MKTSNALGMLVGREVEMFELVPKVRQRQCAVLETDRKRVKSYVKSEQNQNGKFTC